MKTLVGLQALEPSERGAAVTIGTFDGVHVGHRALITRTRAVADQKGLDCAVVTWDRHPAETLRPDKTPPLLTRAERKIELIEEAGVDILVVLPFDEELSSWPPQRFASEVLAKGLGARAVLVGHGWRFGARAAGDVDLLIGLGEELGFDAEGAALAEVAGEPVSSSRAREAVAGGDLDLAATLLGRPFDYEGRVLRGERRGTELGYPTANVAIENRLAHPPRGVYAGRARAFGIWYAAAVNVGVNPQFGGDPATTPLNVEAYLLDFEGDLYDEVMRVEFHKRLRDELAFDSVDDLLEQMAADVSQTADLMRSAHEGRRP